MIKNKEKLASNLAAILVIIAGLIILALVVALVLG
jgi:hypothetical protein